MTKAKWNEKCWNCGSRHMIDQGDYARCEDCGATATPFIETSALCITVFEPDGTKANPSTREASYSPSGRRFPKRPPRAGAG